MPHAPVVPLNGYWLDLPAAAAHVGVHVADLMAAVCRHELHSTNDHLDNAATWMVRTHEVEAWAERRHQLAG